MLHLEKTNHTHNTFACTLGISKSAFLLYTKRKVYTYSEFIWIFYKYIQGNKKTPGDGFIALVYFIFLSNNMTEKYNFKSCVFRINLWQ